jgi:predicted dehydrogenase
MDKISRRRFLQDTAGLLAVSALPVAAVAEATRRTRTVSPNEKVRIACIGFNGRGMNHIESYAKMADVEIVALCDADSSLFPKGIAAIEKAGKPAPKTYQDIRKLLENKEIDAVSIATPNHWHALAAIWAMQHGKQVYVEKPVSHEVSEGRRMVEVSRKTGRLCQVGTQSHSSKAIIDAIAYMHEGNLGKIRLARALCYKRRKSIGKVAAAKAPPSGVDYDLWLGPAPMKPVMREQFHYDWHWQWDYGNGDLGNQGIHQMDIARWGLNKMTLPNGVMSLGGRFGYVDDGETPNTELSFFDYGDSHLIFEVRGLETDKLPPVKGAPGVGVGNIFYGEKGVMSITDNYGHAVAYDNDGNKLAEFNGGGDHFRNFIQAVQSGKREDLHADIEAGHISSALCHLGNISYRLGSEQPFDNKTGAFGDDKDALETIHRTAEHLITNGIVLADSKYMLGEKLRIDPSTETFVGNRKANSMLTRHYREGFVVPAKA